MEQTLLKLSLAQHYLHPLYIICKQNRLYDSAGRHITEIDTTGRGVRVVGDYPKILHSEH